MNFFFKESFYLHGHGLCLHNKYFGLGAPRGREALGGLRPPRPPCHAGGCAPGPLPYRGLRPRTPAFTIFDFLFFLLICFSWGGCAPPDPPACRGLRPPDPCKAGGCAPGPLRSPKSTVVRPLEAENFKKLTFFAKIVFLS